LTLLTRCCKDC